MVSGGAATAVESLPAETSAEPPPTKTLPGVVPPTDVPPAEELMIAVPAANSAAELPNGEFTASPSAVDVGVEATVAVGVACATAGVALAGGV
jgi:hypothetical protein